MSLAVRLRSETQSTLSELTGLTIERELDAQFMAALQGKPVAAMQRRFNDGHRAYVARMNAAPAAWGWVATREAIIGELNATLRIPQNQRYLWNFVTLVPYRGMGIYPRLLNTIIQTEQDADQFWIAYAPENRASAAGIHKAGFVTLAELSFDASGSPAVKPIAQHAGVPAAQLLGFPIVTEKLAACWRCTRTVGAAASPCRTGACCCDYQQPTQACG